LENKNGKFAKLQNQVETQKIEISNLKKATTSKELKELKEEFIKFKQ
jgi:hypothetical protein